MYSSNFHKCYNVTIMIIFKSEEVVLRHRAEPVV